MNRNTHPNPDPQDHSSEHDVEDHDRGLAFDMASLLGRRRLLSLAVAGAGAAVFAACGSSDSTGDQPPTTTGNTSDSTGTTDVPTTTGTCDPIPEETAGPYPGDGSNGVNVLTESGLVRSDIRPSFGSSSGVAEGVLLTIELIVTDTANGCAPLAGAAVYLWHCDREGLYSLYSQGAEDENYLRGVQEADADGRVAFTSIFPGCYSGRWPHVHFEVYGSVDDATAATNIVATSQLALPEDVCNVVFATDGYDQSVRNLGQVTLATDNVFSDGSSQQVATVTGSVADGYTAALTVPV